MLHAFVYNDVAVLVRHWFEVSLKASHLEHGTRVELRVRPPEPHRGSESAAQAITADRPLWRADLFDRVDGSPGGFEAVCVELEAEARPDILTRLLSYEARLWAESGAEGALPLASVGGVVVNLTGRSRARQLVHLQIGAHLQPVFQSPQENIGRVEFGHGLDRKQLGTHQQP